MIKRSIQYLIQHPKIVKAMLISAITGFLYWNNFYCVYLNWEMGVDGRFFDSCLGGFDGCFGGPVIDPEHLYYLEIFASIILICTIAFVDVFHIINILFFWVYTVTFTLELVGYSLGGNQFLSDPFYWWYGIVAIIYILLIVEARFFKSKTMQ